MTYGYEQSEAPPPYEPPQQPAAIPDQQPPAALSVIHDYERIAEEKLKPVEEKIIELRAVHWDVDFDHLPDEVYGPTFSVGGHRWTILLYPRGNQHYGQRECVSIYLQWNGADKREAIHLDHVCAQFAICMSSPKYPTNYTSFSAQHRFTDESNDWGFSKHTEINAASSRDPVTNRDAFLEDGRRTRITAIVRVIDDPTGLLWIDPSEFSSRHLTGYVGFKPEGTLSYLHCILQLLFAIKGLRKTIYSIPSEDLVPTLHTPLALQRLFYRMQIDQGPVSVLELTKSFGWDTLELYMPHDCVEFLIVLLEKFLESTSVGGIIPSLFESTIRRIGNNHLQSECVLAVETDGFPSLGASLVEAIKTRFTIAALPSVLLIQLKTWRYNARNDSLEKIFDPYSYPLEIDMAPYVDSESKMSTSGSHDYVLFSVIMHDGTMTNGVNFIYIKPDIHKDKWYKFDGDRVYPAKEQQALDPHSGENASKVTPYVLGYIRKSQLHDVLAAVQPEDIPSHVRSME